MVRDGTEGADSDNKARVEDVEAERHVDTKQEARQENRKGEDRHSVEVVINKSIKVSKSNNSVVADSTDVRHVSLT